jgi:anti-anti-sigma regulatory factor
MTLRIERISEGQKEIIRLIGRLEQENLETLETETRGSGQVICIDLRDVTLIDIHIVHYFIARQRDGALFQNIPPFIQEWMRREQERPSV